MGTVEQGTIQVDRAGETMTEVVSSIGLVAEIMGGISVASTEQATGVAQVGEAITQMDQVTQQNAALVEEIAAAASILQSQSEEFFATVGVFKLDGSASAALSNVRTPAAKIKSSANEKLSQRVADGTVKPFSVKSIPLSKGPRSSQTRSETGSDEWETF